MAIISGYTVSYLFPSKSIAFKWAKDITTVLAFLLPSMHCKDVGGLGKEKPFKLKLEFDIVWGPDPKSDPSKGNISFYFVRDWYGPIMSINKDAPADTERENVLETALSLCHNKLRLYLTESLWEREECITKHDWKNTVNFNTKTPLILHPSLLCQEKSANILLDIKLGLFFRLGAQNWVNW